MQKKVALTLVLVTLLATGCVRMMVNANLNRHYSEPDIATLTLPVDAGEEVVYFHTALSDYKNFFSNLHGTPVDIKQANPFTVDSGAQKEKMFEEFKKLGMSRLDAERAWRASQKRKSNITGKVASAKTLPPGATSGSILSGNEQEGTEYTLPAVTGSASFSYPASSLEEGLQMRKALFLKLSSLGFSRGGWTVKDEEYHRRANQTVYNNLLKLHNMQDRFMTAKQKKESAERLELYSKKIDEVPSIISYEYHWEGDVKENITGLAATNQLNITLSATEGQDGSATMGISVMYIKMKGFDGQSG